MPFNPTRLVSSLSHDTPHCHVLYKSLALPGVPRLPSPRLRMPLQTSSSLPHARNPRGLPRYPRLPEAVPEAGATERLKDIGTRRGTGALRKG